MSLSPESRTRLRQIRGEHMEGVEVVSITRADLDALLADAAKVEAVRALHREAPKCACGTDHASACMTCVAGPWPCSTHKALEDPR